jgi:CBS domain-containing protein
MNMECPACGHEFIQGQDSCEHCRADLTQLGPPGRVGDPRSGRLHDLILEDPLSQLNAPRPLTLKPTDTVLSAVKLMRKHRFGSVLVLNAEGALEGIFTERDLLRSPVLDLLSPANVALREVMTPRPQTLSEDDTIAHALNRMAVGGYRHIPIVRDGVPVGFVSIRGILSYIAKNAL